MNALLMLSQMLDIHHGVAPIIIIDEYDIPIQQGHTQGFYDEAVAFMRNLFSGGFKDNKHLSHGYLTGILRVAKESIFSGLNNLAVYSVLDESLSEYFGFTHEEVRQIAAYYGASEKYAELCEWYDGYRFGESDIFNPWSIVNYFQRKCKLQAYWVSTSSNDVVGEILADATEESVETIFTRFLELQSAWAERLAGFLAAAGEQEDGEPDEDDGEGASDGKTDPNLIINA
jgi:hypothetical protein